ncbi:MAG: ABC transporter substrate-binding protein [Trueperaceae bacterium]
MTRHLQRPLIVLLLLTLFGVSAAQQQGGTLTAAWAQDPVGLDPHITSAYSSFQILENVLDTLVTLDAEQNVVPSLAESWESSEDGLQWTFHLRDGLVFSNGRQMTAEDVVYTFERMLDPETGSGNAYLLAGVTDVEAPDEDTVVLTLDAPNVALLGHLAVNKSVGIIARESVEDDTINTRPIGTGPFQIVDFQPGNLVRLERNEHYWQDGLPYLDAIDIQILPDESVRRTALVSGDVDWAISVPAQSVEELRNDDDVIVDETTAGAYWYIGVNTESEPLDDPAVRQALAYALQRDNIVQAATFGVAEPTQDPIPSSSAWAFEYAPYDYDPERARQLLEEAGVGDGFELEIMPTTQYEESIRIAQVMQQNLADVGVTANIRTLEWAQWLEEQGAGNYDTFVCSWNGLVDPDDYFYAQHKTGEVFNFTGYSNESVDELLEEGRATQDFVERLPIYEQINRAIVDEAPYIYLYNPLNIHAYRPYVEGFEARPDQAVRFTETWLDN